MIAPLRLGFGQTIESHTTVRHHRELVEDQPPEIAQAETAIQKNDFAAAETLLQKALDTASQERTAMGLPGMV